MNYHQYCCRDCHQDKCYDLSDCGLSDSMVIKSKQIDGVPPQGLLVLTLGLAVGIDGNLGKGTYVSEICVE
jgi:hypothetical protein